MLVVLIGEEIWKTPRFLISVQSLLDVFGYFLLVLIGVELPRDHESVSEKRCHSRTRCARSCTHRNGAEGHHHGTRCRTRHHSVWVGGSDSCLGSCLLLRAAVSRR